MNLYRFFPPHELACHCGNCTLGEDDMSPRFMRRLIDIRAKCDFALILTSAARCPAHNDSIYIERGYPAGGHLAGPHTPHLVEGIDHDALCCHAVDITIYGERAYTLIGLTRQYGMTGVGDNQKGPYSGRLVHLDDLPHGVAGPRPWKWTY